MDKKNNSLGRIPNKPYLVWIMIFCAIIFLVMLPRGGALKVQNFDVRKLMSAANNDELVEISITNDPNGGKDWYSIVGKVKNPLFGREDAPADTPRTLDFKFEGRVTDDMYKQLSAPTSPWTVRENPAGSFWGNILTTILPVLLILGVIYFMLTRQMKASGRMGMNYSKSPARLMSPDKNKVTFADVAGCEESKEEVREIVEFLKNPQKFREIGARIPKGILMVGPPGTGKTLLARAVAGEADVPFYTISGSDFVELFVGVGAARVRDMFEQARKTAPCLVFIDEIDAVGRQRGAGLGGGNDEREQTLNSLLVEMDGFDAQTGIIIIAATNRPDVLDSALLRPGRFDRQVVIDLPDINGREEILKVHAKKVKLADDVDLRKVAQLTAGCSGADLANMLNEGAIIAARKNEKTVTMADLFEARDKVFFGREHRRVMDSEERSLTAYHEAGHALVQALIDDGKMPVHKVTIIPRGQSLGSTMFIPAKDIMTQTRGKMLNQICASLGGRVAEEIVFSDITNGASGDIKSATAVARKMVCDWGMSELGPVALGNNQEHIFLGKEFARDQNFSERTAEMIDAQIKKIIEGQLDRARDILKSNRDKLDMIANELLLRETIEGEDVYKIVRGEFTPTTKEDIERAAAEKAAAALAAEEREKRAVAPGEAPESPSPQTV